VRNALDAGADSIEITLEEHGLKSITVKDNGIGIDRNDIEHAGKRHHTSKLKDLNDLESLHSYGFRGEGLNSICQISDNVTVVTKTKQDTVGQHYSLDKQATVKSKKPTGLLPQSGTVITAEKPFYDLPVRRQQAERNKQTQQHIIKEMVIRYALVQHHVRFVLNRTWIKPSTTNLLSRVSMLFSRTLSTMLSEWVEEKDELKIRALIPKADSNPAEIYKENKVYVYVNQRPIHYVASELKQAINAFKIRCRETLGFDDQKKLPFLFLHIQIPPTEYDGKYTRDA
ncbi:histidine kinase-like ATPase, partial [Choanephora cucurbitarum]